MLTTKNDFFLDIIFFSLFTMYIPDTYIIFTYIIHIIYLLFNIGTYNSIHIIPIAVSSKPIPAWVII